MNISDMISPLDYGIVGLYLVSVLGIGFYVSFRKGHTEDLFLAGRSLHWPNVGLSIFGTNVSPSFMIAGFAAAYDMGMVGANYEWLAWIFLFLLSMLFIPHYLKTNVSTMPEFLEKRYGRSSRVFLSFFALFSTMVLWIGGTLFIGGLLLSQILGWELWLCALLLSLVATSFTVAGGLAAVVVTDSFQSILMIVASTWLAIMGMIKVGSFENLFNSVPPEYWVLCRPRGDEVYPWDAVWLGYPILGIWFWCTDQTIVQRALGAKDRHQGQLGCIFAGFLKVVTPLIFFVPGVMCKILHPELETSKDAYMTMVVNYMPVGAVGLVIAVLMAALISTVDSGLNSLSTVFTLDIYTKYIKPDSRPDQIKTIGRVVTIAGGILAMLVVWAFDYISQYMDLFTMSQSIISFLSPAMAAVFVVGVLWRRATPISGFLTLVIGTIVSLTVGVLYIFVYPPPEHDWPHFMKLVQYLFIGMVVFQVIVSLFTKPLPADQGLEPITFAYLKKSGDKMVWLMWLILAVVMIFIYLLFNRVWW